LAETLFGSTRRRILALLYSNADQSFHLRRVVRETSLSPGSVHRELRQLVEVGIVARTQQGRQVYFRADPACPVFSELRGLIVKTAGVADVLGRALAPLSDRIRAAFIYGSFAAGSERSRSDVDLMVVGEATFAEVSDALGPPERALGREVNPVVYPESEFRAKAGQSRQFMRTVLRGPKVFLLGDEHELERMAGKRLAD